MQGPADFILLLTDQERAPPPYEGEALGRWRREQLPARRWMLEHGVSFTRHYTGATACTPSRPTLWTGQYPDTHGVTQTWGFGKGAEDPRLRWLAPDEIPTVGHWLKAAGYDVRYEGKWHVSHADLFDPATGEPLATNTDEGEVLERNVRAYEEADPLAAFGFEGWVGPEPHGASPSNSGLIRDPLIARRAAAWLRERNRRRRAGDPEALRPFLLIVCFINPHDIVFWPQWALRSPLKRGPADPPPIPAAPTEGQSLRSKPRAQAAYVEAYPSAYGPPRLVRLAYRLRAEAYRRTYYRLHAEVDRALMQVLEEGLAGPSADRTLFLLSSDHGELLGSHGGQHQKWMSLYDECTRVPFVVAHTGAFGPQGREVGGLVSTHVDLLPTLLGLAGVDRARAEARLRESHRELLPLPGRDLGPWLREPSREDPSRAVYLMSRDAIFDGESEATAVAGLLGIDKPIGPLRIRPPRDVGTSFEALVARVPESEGGGGRLHKLVRSYDDPAEWREPELRLEALADEWELYDLERDPVEADNLWLRPEAHLAREHMRLRLEQERARCHPIRSDHKSIE